MTETAADDTLQPLRTRRVHCPFVNPGPGAASISPADWFRKNNPPLSSSVTLACPDAFPAGVHISALPAVENPLPDTTIVSPTAIRLSKRSLVTAVMTGVVGDAHR